MLEWLFSLKKKFININIAEKPIIEVPDQEFNEGFDALNSNLLRNLSPPLGKHSDVWARPAGKFPAAYLWDSAFISQAWKIWDPTIAFKILKPFVEFQDKDGRMPHQVFLGRFVSGLSNPPFLSWAVNEIFNFYRDKKWLEYFNSPILEFINFRKEKRFNATYGLYYWIDSYESGIDNTPRFRSTDESEDYGVSNLGSIDLNAEIALQFESLIKMMEDLGRKEEINTLQKNFSTLIQNIDRKLWDKDKGIFGDLDLTTGEIKTIDTIASYFPLVISNLNEEKYNQMANRLKNKEKYNTKIPLPTVARDHKQFSKDMWRGPVWINTAYLVVKGLWKQGFKELASDYAYRLCKGVYYTWKNEGHFYEFYDPERYDISELNRKKGNFFKKITLGSKPVKDFAGWTALANSMIIEFIFGLEPKENDWTIEPHIPIEWLETNNPISLKLPFYNISLEIIPESEEGLKLSYQLDKKESKMQIKNGETSILKKMS